MVRKKRLNIDLTTRKIEVEDLKEGIIKKYLGGRGLNMKVLYEMTNRDTDPLGSENPLIFGVGLLAGTYMPTSGRYNVTAKSPATGILGDANSGGFFGPELKYAGYDQLVITGQSKEPVYININNDNVEIKTAVHLWGKNVWETNELLKKELGSKCQIAVIGPAGENLVKIAGIMNNRNRAAGRTGLGAVMGSKKLKAVVVRGTKSVMVKDPESFKKVVEELSRKAYSAPSYKIRSTLGTPMLVELYNKMGVLPTRNSQTGVFEDAEQIGGQKLHDEYVVKARSCFACLLHCSRDFTITSGPFKGTRGEGPEFESISALGSRCGNGNLESIMFANNLCNKFGLDTISTGDVIAFAMECYEKNLLSSKDTGGLDLSWGNYQSILELIEQIAYRRGLGNILADGVLRASKQINGSEYYAIHVKGLEPPAQEIRGLKAWGLGWATSSRGCDHCRSFPLPETTWTPEEAEDFFGDRQAADRFSSNGKGKLVKWCEDFNAATDCLDLCRIFTMGLALPIDKIVEAVNAATGYNISEETFLKVGERINNLERLINLEYGITGADDTLPDRFREERLPEGNSKGQTLDVREMVKEYYKLRGWEGENGYPSQQKLKELELDNLIK